MSCSKSPAEQEQISVHPAYTAQNSLAVILTRWHFRPTGHSVKYSQSRHRKTETSLFPKICSYGYAGLYVHII
jgi:hypothetical protein